MTVTLDVAVVSAGGLHPSSARGGDGLREVRVCLGALQRAGIRSVVCEFDGRRMAVLGPVSSTRDRDEALKIARALGHGVVDRIVIVPPGVDRSMPGSRRRVAEARSAQRRREDVIDRGRDARRRRAVSVQPNVSSFRYGRKPAEPRYAPPASQTYRKNEMGWRYGGPQSVPGPRRPRGVMGLLQLPIDLAGRLLWGVP